MAKKAKQLLFEGAGDVIPDVVRDAADEYVAAKRKLGKNLSQLLVCMNRHLIVWYRLSKTDMADWTI